MKRKSLDNIASSPNELKSAILLVDSQFNSLTKRPEIYELKKVPKENKYFGWVVKDESTTKPNYSFLVHTGMGEPLEAIDITNNGKKNKVIYLGKDPFNCHVLGMGVLNSEPNFLHRDYTVIIAGLIGFKI